MGIVPSYALHHIGESIVSANFQVPILNSEFRTFRTTFELLFLSISCLLACLREPLLQGILEEPFDPKHIRKSAPTDKNFISKSEKPKTIALSAVLDSA